jgi:hypothetical protein
METLRSPGSDSFAGLSSLVCAQEGVAMGGGGGHWWTWLSSSVPIPDGVHRSAGQ